MRKQRYLKGITTTVLLILRTTTAGPSTWATRVHEVAWRAMFRSVRQRYSIRNHLQESSDNGTEAENASSSNLDVGSSVLRVLGRARTGGRGAALASRIVAGSICAAGRRWGGGREQNGVAAVCTDGNRAGLVEHGASALQGQGVDARTNGGDVSWQRLCCNGCWLCCNSSWLGGDD